MKRTKKAEKKGDIFMQRFKKLILPMQGQNKKDLHWFCRKFNTPAKPGLPEYPPEG